MIDLETILSSVKSVRRELEPDLRSHLDRLTKPRGSLGTLEEIAVRYCLMTDTRNPVLGKKRIYTFAADHGVAAEGVSAYPASVTPQMVRNMLAGGAAVNVLARHAGAEVRVVDMGVNDHLDDAPGLIRRKIRRGSGNIAAGPAMTLDEALQALGAGEELAREAAREGVALIGTGDMGIANTTPSSALYAALLPCPVEEIVGRGTGIDDATLDRKKTVIEQALTVNGGRLSDPLTTLAALGGFEIAGICGLLLGAAACRVPVVVDGFISSAAALTACRMCDRVKEYLFFSHCSAEKGHAIFFKRYGVVPLLNLNMRLGEGTGAALAMMIIEAAIKIYNEMATFDSAGISKKSS